MTQATLAISAACPFCLPAMGVDHWDGQTHWVTFCLRCQAARAISPSRPAIRVADEEDVMRLTEGELGMLSEMVRGEWR